MISTLKKRWEEGCVFIKIEDRLLVIPIGETGKKSKAEDSQEKIKEILRELSQSFNNIGLERFRDHICITANNRIRPLLKRK